eukprot:scaffold277338_cov29-Tisochrysis_lutea.AAC.4
MASESTSLDGSCSSGGTVPLETFNFTQHTRSWHTRNIPNSVRRERGRYNEDTLATNTSLLSGM